MMSEISSQHTPYIFTVSEVLRIKAPYLTGVIAYRYFLNIEPLSSLSQEQVVALMAPMVQDLLDPTKPLPGVAG